MAIKAFGVILSLLVYCSLGWADTVVFFSPPIDQRTLFKSSFPSLKLQSKYDQISSHLSLNQQRFDSADLDAQASQIRTYISKNNVSKAFWSIGIGQHIFDYTYNKSNFIYRMCPLFFNPLKSENDLEKFLQLYLDQVAFYKKHIESEFKVEVIFIYMGGVIKSQHIAGKNNFCKIIGLNDEIYSFQPMDFVRVFSKKIQVVYSPLFVSGVYDFYMGSGDVKIVSDRFLYMVLPYID